MNVRRQQATCRQVTCRASDSDGDPCSRGRRRPGRADARDRPRLARHRRHRRGDARRAASRRASNAIKSRPARWRSSAGSACARSCATPACRPTIRNDVAYRTTSTGIELSRIHDPLPRASAITATDGPDTWWPTPEPPHRINQIYLEPMLFAHAAAQPRIRILNRTAFEDVHRRTTTASSPPPAISTAATRSRIACRLSGRLRRRALDRSQGDRRKLPATPVDPARAVDLYPRARADRPAAGTAGLDVPRRSIRAAAARCSRSTAARRWLIHNFL